MERCGIPEEKRIQGDILIEVQNYGLGSASSWNGQAIEEKRGFDGHEIAIKKRMNY